MRIAIGADHAGVGLKQALVELLHGLNHEVTDVGAFDTQPVDYPDIAELLAPLVQRGEVDRGILICGSGVGVSVAANKFAGIRAGICHDSYSAHQGVEHDDINVLVLGSRIIGVELAKELVAIYLNAQFSGAERHRRRLAKVQGLEQKRAERNDGGDG